MPKKTNSDPAVTLGETSSAAALADYRAAEIAQLVGLTEATVLRRLEQAHGNRLVRSVFAGRWPERAVDAGELDVEDLGQMTAAFAIAGNHGKRIAAAIDLDENAVNRKLGGVHGRMLVRTALAADWPERGDDDAELDHEGLGALTASAALAYDRVAEIVEATGLGRIKVRRMLEAVHGKTLVRNVFAAHWVAEEDGDVDIDSLGSLTSAAALAADHVADIARVVNLGQPSVRRRLEDVHGNRLVRNVFEYEWPDVADEDEEAGDDEEDDRDGEGPLLGAMTVAAALALGLEQRIADAAELSLPTVRRKLNAVRGNMLVRNAFQPRRPRSEAEGAENRDPRGASRDRPTSRHGRGMEDAAPGDDMPRVPKPLVTAYKRGKLALFCGSGLSLGQDVGGNFPSWRELPHRLLEACADHDRLKEKTIAQKRGRFEDRMSLDQMLSELNSLKTDLSTDYHNALTHIFRPLDAAPGAVHRAIASLGVDALLTTNFDQLLEQVPESPLRSHYTWQEATDALADLRAARKVLLKVHGTAERPSTVIMTEIDYHRVRADIPYQRVVSYLLQDHMFLFLGYGMNDPGDLDLVLRSNAQAFKSAGQPHYVLLVTPSEADVDRYERDFNVRVIECAEYARIPYFLQLLSSHRSLLTR